MSGTCLSVNANEGDCMCGHHGGRYEIDPANVKVGDVVEVEANDGSWLVRGEVRKTDEPGTDYPLQVIIDHGESGAVWPCVPGNTVRLIRRAAPEPDPEQVERLAALLHDEKPAARLEFPDGWRDYARNLLREGVRVQPEEQS